MNTFKRKTMKIKDRIIKMLGGLTQQDLIKATQIHAEEYGELQEAYYGLVEDNTKWKDRYDEISRHLQKRDTLRLDEGMLLAVKTIMEKLDSMYGMPADEWCENAYTYIQDYMDSILLEAVNHAESAKGGDNGVD